MAALTRISGDGQVALRYGLEEAIFLDSLIFWYRTNRGDNRNFRDGRWWSHNSVKAYEEVFPWWSAKQVRRIIDSCKAKGAVLSGNYNQDRRDRTFWYSPSDEVLALYGEPPPEQTKTETGKCNCPNGQMQVTERADSFAQTGEPLPCITHVEPDMIPPLPPTGAMGTKPKKTANRFALQEDAKPLLRAYVGDDEELRQALGEFILLRQDLRAINSKQGVSNLLRELDRLSDGDRTLKLQLIRQSCANSWKSVFPLRNSRDAPASGGWAPDPEVY